MSTENSTDPQSFTEELAASITGVGLIWAQTPDGVIGKDGDMPWHLPEDLRHFTRLTTGHPVIMGRKTWLSFPDKYRPLPGRTNIVITRQKRWADTPEAEGAVVVPSLDDALLESQFVDGGDHHRCGGRRRHIRPRAWHQLGGGRLRPSGRLADSRERHALQIHQMVKD